MSLVLVAIICIPFSSIFKKREGEVRQTIKLLIFLLLFLPANLFCQDEPPKDLKSVELGDRTEDWVYHKANGEIRIFKQSKRVVVSIPTVKTLTSEDERQYSVRALEFLGDNQLLLNIDDTNSVALSRIHLSRSAIRADFIQKMDGYIVESSDIFVTFNHSGEIIAAGSNFVTDIYYEREIHVPKAKAVESISFEQISDVRLVAEEPLLLLIDKDAHLCWKLQGIKENLPYIFYISCKDGELLKTMPSFIE